MSVITLPGVGFTLTIPNTTTLVANDDTTYGVDAVAVPPNCRSLIIYNMDSANRIFVKFAPVTEITMGMMTVSNSIVIPSLSTITFAVGYLGDRPNLGQEQDTAFYVMAEAGTNVQVNITYLMGRGTQLL